MQMTACEPRAYQRLGLAPSEEIEGEKFLIKLWLATS